MAEQAYHDSRISAVKAICIILMVVGHSGPPDQLRHIIYMFHMPCFFLISGFLLKDKYFHQTGLFVKRRIKGLYWPYIKWLLICLLLHNFFAYCHVYGDYYTLHQIIKNVFYIVFITGHAIEPLLGGYWFIKDLFVASILSFLFLLALGKWFKINNITLWGGVLVSILLAFVLGIMPISVPVISSTTMQATSFYLIGYWLSRQPYGRTSNLWIGMGCLVAVVIVSFFFHESISVRSVRIFPFFFMAIIGSIGIINLAGFVKGRALKVLDYIGSKTLYILTFHYLSFKLLSLVKIWQFNLPIDALNDYIVRQHNSYYWILYSIVGVAFSLAIWEISNYIRHKLIKPKEKLNGI